MHAARIVRGGLEVYPRLVAPLQGPASSSPRSLASGIAALDRLFGGGLDRGTCTMIGGNSGVGKSSLGLAFLAAAAAQGERGVLYSFDEWPAEVIHRCESIGLRGPGADRAGPAAGPEGQPAGLSPEQFCNWVRSEVEREGTRLVMIDTVNGYEMCTPRQGRLPQPPPAARRLPQVQGRHADPGQRDRQDDRRADDVRDRDELHLPTTRVLIKSFEDERGLRKAIGVTRKRLGRPRRPIPRVSG